MGRRQTRASFRRRAGWPRPRNHYTCVSSTIPEGNRNGDAGRRSFSRSGPEPAGVRRQAGPVRRPLRHRASRGSLADVASATGALTASPRAAMIGDGAGCTPAVAPRDPYPALPAVPIARRDRADRSGPTGPAAVGLSGRSPVPPGPTDRRLQPTDRRQEPAPTAGARADRSPAGAGSYSRSRPCLASSSTALRGTNLP